MYENCKFFHLYFSINVVVKVGLRGYLGIFFVCRCLCVFESANRNLLVTARFFLILCMLKLLCMVASTFLRVSIGVRVCVYVLD